MANTILAKMAVQIAANTAQFDKSMVKSSQAVQKFSVESELANTKVGGLAKTISSFANPVTAAVAVVGGLAAAYARSTIGAKDLEFAQNQLAATTTILTNSFAGLFSSAEDGEGFFTGLLNSALEMLGPAGIGLAAVTKTIALAQEQLEDFRRNEIIARTKSDELLSDNLEKITLINESEAKYAEKVHQVGEILANINEAEAGVLASLNAQLEAKQRQLAGDKENEKLKDEELMLQLEISKESKKYERLRQQILRIESNITDQYNKQNKARQVQITPVIGGIELGALPSGIGSIDSMIKEAVSKLPDLSQPFISTAKEMINISGLVVGGITDIATALGEAAVSGGEDFGRAFLRSLGKFAQQFGGLLISIGIGEKALKFGGPGAKIAAGIALVALGAAVSRLMASKPSMSGGGAEGGGFNRPTLGQLQNSGFQDTTINFRIQGSDLVAAYALNLTNNAQRKA